VDEEDGECQVLTEADLRYRRRIREEWRSEMSRVSTEAATPEAVILATLAHLGSGQFGKTTARFAEAFRFTDHGIGLEFGDRARLAEFFQKVRELYPDSTLTANRVFTSGDHVIVEWTYRATITEPFYGGLPRRRPVSVQGVSVVRTHDGEITEWADYYDGLTSRRSALAVYFQEWVEL
jgi:steroid delta-isomerase-like uncharacterized protein